ncbi:hypothetical protein [Nitratireductor soli]|uniref:hypothetical protein n=1 Tax=Nitratireductor soli TaxID=1670619 RepID=UPI000AA71115|nr:hypothetical protein [Nitratireductor soli]
MSSMKMSDILEYNEQMPFSNHDLVLMHLHEASRLVAKVPDFKEHQLFSYLLGMCVELLVPIQAPRRLPDGRQTH